MEHMDLCKIGVDERITEIEFIKIFRNFAETCRDVLGGCKHVPKMAERYAVNDADSKDEIAKKIEIARLYEHFHSVPKQSASSRGI